MKKQLIRICIIISLLIMIANSIVLASNYGGFTFYDKNGCHGKVEGKVIRYPGGYMSAWIDNDDARSLLVGVLPAGSYIRVHDDGKASKTKDDWAEIWVTKTTENFICIGSFETSGWYGPNSEIYVRYHRETSKGNLDGKVSSLRYYFPSEYYR